MLDIGMILITIVFVSGGVVLFWLIYKNKDV